MQSAQQCAFPTSPGNPGTGFTFPGFDELRGFAEYNASGECEGNNEEHDLGILSFVL